jgi:hypothetical protein
LKIGSHEHSTFGSGLVLLRGTLRLFLGFIIGLHTATLLVGHSMRDCWKRLGVLLVTRWEATRH